MLEKKVSEYGKQINELKNELEYYANIPKDPLYEDYKKRISELIEKDIANIVSEEPWNGGKWFVTEIIFIDPSLVRVEFEDGHNSLVSHIRIIRPEENFRFEEIK